MSRNKIDQNAFVGPTNFGSEGFEQDTKRLFDIVISIAVLPFAVGLSLVFGLLFLLVNRENPVFVQNRVGQHGEVFKLVKLRCFARPVLNLRIKSKPRRSYVWTLDQ